MVLYIGTGAAPLRGSFLLAGLVLFWGLGFWQGKKRGFDALTLVLASVLTPLLSVFCAHFFYRLVNLAYDPPAFAELFALWQDTCFTADCWAACWRCGAAAENEPFA